MSLVTKPEITQIPIFELRYYYIYPIIDKYNLAIFNDYPKSDITHIPDLPSFHQIPRIRCYLHTRCSSRTSGSGENQARNIMWSSKQMLQQELGLTLTLIYGGSWNHHVLYCVLDPKVGFEIMKCWKTNGFWRGFLRFGRFLVCFSTKIQTRETGLNRLVKIG